MTYKVVETGYPAKVIAQCATINEAKKAQAAYYANHNCSGVALIKRNK